jgi:hypothetical protein
VKVKVVPALDASPMPQLPTPIGLEPVKVSAAGLIVMGAATAAPEKAASIATERMTLFIFELPTLIKTLTEGTQNRDFVTGVL